MRNVAIALAVLCGWTAITVVAGPPLTGEGDVVDGMTNGLASHILLAGLAAAGFVVITQWEGAGFGPPRPWASLRVTWLHLIYVAGFLAIAAAGGASPGWLAGLVLVNALLVGFSEEVMFRSILLAALRRALGVWPAVILSSAIFGAIHLLNGFVTGDFAGAGVQAVAATMSGVGFAAIMVRTGSVWPGAVLHGLWDFGLFMMGLSFDGLSDPGSAGDIVADAELGVGAASLLLVLPVFLFGLWLLRKER
jgi:membrane protease YdiL (CAAX protease family)